MQRAPPAAHQAEPKKLLVLHKDGALWSKVTSSKLLGSNTRKVYVY